jgi:hypothetical protein
MHFFAQPALDLAEHHAKLARNARRRKRACGVGIASLFGHAYIPQGKKVAC